MAPDLGLPGVAIRGVNLANGAGATRSPLRLAHPHPGYPPLMPAERVLVLILLVAFTIWFLMWAFSGGVELGDRDAAGALAGAIRA